MATERRQADRSDASMRAALDAARSLISTQGYNGTSMRQISEASGVSTGNLYHHFGSKELIFQRLISAPDAVREYIRIFRYGVLPRQGEASASLESVDEPVRFRANGL